MEDKSLERVAVDEFIRYHHNPIVSQKNTEIATLQSQITALKEESERLMSNIHLSLDVNKEKSLEIADLNAKLLEGENIKMIMAKFHLDEVTNLTAKLSVCKEAGGYMYRRLKKVSDGSDELAIKLWEESLAKDALEGGK